MKIKKYLNCTKQEIQSKKFNIFIGISLGNKYFSKKNIKGYILWALEHTRDDVLVLIADKNHSIDYEVLNGYSSGKALQVASMQGAEIERAVKKIIHDLPKEKRTLVKICKWEDARESFYYKNKIKIFLEEFEKNEEFHDFIIKIVQENLKTKAKDLTLRQLEKLSLYILDELPVILNGVEFEGKIYDLHPYPGFSSLDDLLTGLQKGEIFPKLAKKLEIKNKTAEVEAYIE